MALLKIARLGHPVLRHVAEDVSADEIASPAFQRLIDDMADTMRDSDGVGLAGPQVYQSKRVILVEVKTPNPRYPDMPAVPLTALINPTFVDQSDALVDGWEGCLSIPDLRGKVPRHQSVTVQALDREGRPVQLHATEFFARVLQHEVDHLDGVMFLERMTDLKQLAFLKEFGQHFAV